MGATGQQSHPGTQKRALFWLKNGARFFAQRYRRSFTAPGASATGRLRPAVLQERHCLAGRTTLQSIRVRQPTLLV